MGEINDFNLTPQRNYAIPLIAVVSVMLLIRIGGAPEPIETTYTEDEAAIVAAATQILEDNPTFTSSSAIEAYRDALTSTLNFTSCDYGPVSFSNQSDMLEYLTRQYELMEDLEGSGSCITYSGFPSSEIGAANALAAELEPSVVKIEIGFSSGTGFIISDSLIFTNFHVLADDNDKPHENITVTTLDGRTYQAEYVAGTFSTDVGILKTKTPILNAKPVKFSSKRLAYGEPVLAIGHPQGLGDWRSTVGIYYGEMDNIFGVQGPRFSLPSQSGSSGSPIFNLDGELVAAIYGMNDIAEFSARNLEESRYQVPLHAPILSSYAVAAGVSLENISKFLEALESKEN
jgi:S1-C subfamily serine protease